MSKYVKKPVVIEAVEWTGGNHLITETFMKGSGATIDFSKSTLGVIKVPTLEGVMSANVGDFIIKGIKGEFYPCKPDIFHASYDLVDRKEAQTKLVFEEYTGPAFGLDFGRAIAALKAGKRVARKGWNGKGMFIFMRPSDELNVDMIVNQVKSLPRSLKDYFRGLFSWTAEDLEHTAGPKTVSVHFSAYLCMYAADGSIVNGWLASQSDMLSEDWEIL